MQLNTGSYLTSSIGPFMSAYKFNETASWKPLSSSIARTAGVNQLMINGFCELSSSYNIGSPITSDNSLGTTYVFQETTYQTKLGSVYIPVNTAQSYSFSAWVRSAGTTGSVLYMGYACYDKNKLFIPIYTQGGIGNTTLAAQLNVGDKTASISSNTNWALTGDPYYTKYINIYLATDPDYYTPYAYTRTNALYTTQSGTNLYLTTPWAGATIPAGTPVSNGRDGGTYDYVLNVGTTVPATWTYLSTTLVGEGNVQTTGHYRQFKYGTSYILWMALVNYGGVGNDLRFGKIVFGNIDDPKVALPYNKNMSVSSQNIVMCGGMNEII